MTKFKKIDLLKCIESDTFVERKINTRSSEKCMNKEIEEEITIRVLYFSDEFTEFFEALDKAAQKQVDKVINIIKSQKQISTKFLKKLENTNNNQFEIRISTTNKREFRILAIGIDDDNILDAEEVLVLNGFLKKDNKDYQKALRKSDNIINDFLEDESEEE